jgi:hypothetical protein
VLQFVDSRHRQVSGNSKKCTFLQFFARYRAKCFYSLMTIMTPSKVKGIPKWPYYLKMLTIICQLILQNFSIFTVRQRADINSVKQDAGIDAYLTSTSNSPMQASTIFTVVELLHIVQTLLIKPAFAGSSKNVKLYFVILVKSVNKFSKYWTWILDNHCKSRYPISC